MDGIRKRREKNPVIVLLCIHIYLKHFHVKRQTKTKQKTLNKEILVIPISNLDNESFWVLFK